MFLPGEGPFHAKGLIYKGLVASTDARCPGGYAAVLARIDDERMKNFLTQNFLAASWYDVMPLLAFSKLAAQVANVPHVKYAHDGARFTANRDINGVHRFFLKLASPKLVADRLPRLMMQYFDFGRVEGVATGPRSYELSAHEIPEPIAQWLMLMIEGFVPVALQLAGAKSVVAKIDPPEPDGSAKGVALVSTRLHLTWI
jgi:uncharacterized protein (TIGR02265 family)